MDWIKKFLLFFNKIQLHIITIFLLLLGASSIGIIYFTYTKNYQSVLDLSDTIVKQAGTGIVEKIKDLTNQSDLVGKITAQLIGDPTDISKQNKKLIEDLIHDLDSDPNLRSINVARIDGDYLAVINRKVALLDRSRKDIPQGTVYAVRTIQRDANGPGIETWQYLTADHSLLKEVVLPTDKNPYDPTQDGWFIKLREKPEVMWENAYLPRGSKPGEGEFAISIAFPLLGKDHKLAGALAMNVSWLTLSKFVAGQVVGKSGKVLVLDEQGNIVLPLKDQTDSLVEKLKAKLISQVYADFQEKKNPVAKYDFEGEKYLFYFIDFPVPLGTKWIVLIGVPFLDFFGDVIRTQQESLLFSLGVLIIATLLVFLFSKKLSQPIIELASQVDKIRHFNFDPTLPIKTHIDEILILESSIHNMKSALHSFAKYLPQAIVKALIAQGQEIALGGKREKITLMFTDIKDFSSVAESTHIYALVTSLEHYFDMLSKIILQSEGTIDKYIGDSIMAFWGAPTPVTDPMNQACRAALKCHTACNLQNQSLGLPPWFTRFGIHAGEVIVGNFGTNDRMNYTAIGDVVNTTSRISALNKVYQTSIIISDTIYEQVSKNFVVRPLDYIAVKGKKSKMMIYELVGAKEGDLKAFPEQITLCEKFSSAYELFHQGKIGEAKKILLSLKDVYSADYPIKLYLERIEEIEKSGLPINPPQINPPQNPPSSSP